MYKAAERRTDVALHVGKNPIESIWNKTIQWVEFFRTWNQGIRSTFNAQVQLDPKVIL